MENKLVIMSFSSVYEQESFYRDKEHTFIDLKREEGVNCYCTPEAEVSIKKAIESCPLKGIHYLDSGNYHYVSKFWMEKITEPFSLLLFDNHTDMQEAAFWGLLSCGSWVRAALEENPMLKKVCIVGPKDKDFENCVTDAKVMGVSGEDLKTGRMKVFQEFLDEDTTPIYLSVDKDILSEKETVTNWDQGNVSFDELRNWILEAALKRTLIGADVCGESLLEGGFLNEHDLQMNDSINKRLLHLLETALG